jgi:1,4-alpha-glucan branching enzyme
MTTACAARLPPATLTVAAGVRFQLVNPEATSVAVAGTFNGWSITDHSLSRDAGSGIWTRVVALPAGEHHFMFVVDGRTWVSPPLAEGYVDDGFGSRNGLVMVRSKSPLKNAGSKPEARSQQRLPKEP